MGYHAGLDWGGAVHAVCVVDEAGRIVVRFDVRHDAEGIAELIARLARIAPSAEMPIAIERPSGLLVDALLEAGYPVVAIHPNVVKACRPRYRAAAGKSDPGDAYILADILRTDGHRFRPLQPCSDEIRALRALVRSRDDLVTERVWRNGGSPICCAGRWVTCSSDRTGSDDLVLSRPGPGLAALPAASRRRASVEACPEKAVHA